MKQLSGALPKHKPNESHEEWARRMTDRRLLNLIETWSGGGLGLAVAKEVAARFRDRRRAQNGPSRTFWQVHMIANALSAPVRDDFLPAASATAAAELWGRLNTAILRSHTVVFLTVSADALADETFEVSLDEDDNVVVYARV